MIRITIHFASSDLVIEAPREEVEMIRSAVEKGAIVKVRDRGAINSQPVHHINGSHVLYLTEN